MSLHVLKNGRFLLRTRGGIFDFELHVHTSVVVGVGKWRKDTWLWYPILLDSHGEGAIANMFSDSWVKTYALGTEDGCVLPSEHADTSMR